MLYIGVGYIVGERIWPSFAVIATVYRRLVPKTS